MKKIILMLLLLATTAYGYRLHVVYSMGGGLTATGVRTIITYGNGNSVATAKDSTITTTISATTSPIEKNWYLPDSLVSYSVTKIYYCSPDTFVEQVDNVLPIEFERLVRGQLALANTGITTVLDSLDDQVWATAGTVTLSQADIDSIVAGVIAGTIASNGTGIFAVTLYARDTINNAFVPNINLTAVSGATNLFATTGSTGAATFNVDAATWTFNALGSPYTWVPFSRAVAGSITDTITGGGVLVAAAPSPDKATVYGTVDCYSCFVRFTLDAPSAVIDTSTGYLISQKVYDLKTNAAGSFQQALPKTENMIYMSGTQKLHPKWRVVISRTNVALESNWGQPFSIDADSTELNIGELFQ